MKMLLPFLGMDLWHGNYSKGRIKLMKKGIKQVTVMLCICLMVGTGVQSVSESYEK